MVAKSGVGTNSSVKVQSKSRSNATSSAKDVVVRFVISDEEKTQFQRACKSRGVNMSQRLRQMVLSDLGQYTTVSSAADGAAAGTASTFQLTQSLTPQAGALSAILSDAAEKNQASGLPEPTIAQIDEYIDKIRQDRINAAVI